MCVCLFGAQPSVWGHVFGVIALAPLAMTTQCHIPSFQTADLHAHVSASDWLLGKEHKPAGAPRFGNYLFVWLTAAWLSGVLVFHRKSFDHEDALHRWAFRYAMLAMAQGLVNLTRPWMYVLCPSRLDAVLAGYSGFLLLCYATGQAALGITALHRLQFVTSDAAALRGWKLLYSDFAAALCAVAARMVHSLRACLFIP